MLVIICLNSAAATSERGFRGFIEWNKPFYDNHFLDR